MDYKKILKSRKLRLKILSLLSFIPDKTMLKIQYRIKTGHSLNLKNPKRFTEKLQWYKLYYKNPLMIQCVDKYDVREYVKSKGLEDILIHCYGIYDSVEDIRWRDLPSQFVIKDTLGSGGNTVIVVNNKSKQNISELKKTISEWTQIDSKKKDGGREWPYYSGKKHRILIEQLIVPEKDANGLLDYKFFCFNGKVVFLYVMGNRKIGENVCVSIFDRQFRLMKVHRDGDATLEGVKKPKNYDEMIYTAEKLASDFPHVRVDLYNNNGIIKFGELTFYNASGYMKYVPDKFDYIVGQQFVLSTMT